MREFAEWITSDDHKAQQCKKRICAVEPEHPQEQAGLAASIAYDAGLQEGLREAGRRLVRILER